MNTSIPALKSVAEYWRSRMEATQAEYFSATDEYLKAMDAWLNEMEAQYGTRVAD
jgi:hypothetical protein